MNGNEKFSHFSRVHSILRHNNRKACHRITWRSFYVHHRTTTQQQYSHNNHFVSAHSRGRHWRLFLQRYFDELLLCVLPEMEHVYCPSSPGFLFHSPGGKYTLLRTFPGCQHHRMRNIQYRSNMRSGTKVPFPE